MTWHLDSVIFSYNEIFLRENAKKGFFASHLTYLFLGFYYFLFQTLDFIFQSQIVCSSRGRKKFQNGRGPLHEQDLWCEFWTSILLHDFVKFDVQKRLSQFSYTVSAPWLTTVINRGKYFSMISKTIPPRIKNSSPYYKTC